MRVAPIRIGGLGAALVLVLGGASSTGCDQAPPSPASTLTTPYSAVFLNNNQMYFGRMEGWGTPHPVLTEVYYVQTQVNQETKEIKNALVKRNSEWHAPDRMLLNASQVLFVEPVAEQSTVAKLIEELKRRN